MVNMKAIDWSNPGAIISMIVLALIAVEMVKIGFPKLVAGFTALAGIGNFTFADFFASDGIVTLVLSAGVLIGILVLFGVKMGKSKR